MPLDEFTLIKRYFEQCGSVTSGPGGAAGVVVGIGDDCAILRLAAQEEMVITTDTLVAGVHFPEQADPAQIAHRALRVNISDIAAMGAQPQWFLLALTLPEADQNWLEDFSRGLSEVADEYNCRLVGGDTTRGPLAITISALGSVPEGGGLVRSGAQSGDIVFVTGSLGDAAAGLAVIEGRSAATNTEYLLKRYWHPSPRVSEGLVLRDYASAAIDISDGVLADLGHIVRASGVGGEIALDSLPLSRSLIEAVGREDAIALALSAGDDYELCFTVPPDKVGGLEEKISEGLLVAQAIGRIVPGSGLICVDAAGQAIDIVDVGYRHF